jgi:hypothetical protein
MPILPRKPEESPVQGSLGAHQRWRRGRPSDPGEGKREALPQLRRQLASRSPRQPVAGLLRLPNLTKSPP